MNIEELRNYALARHEAEECFPFGEETFVYKIKGKIFLLINSNAIPVKFNVKCNPERAITLREEYGCIEPGYHMNKKHWNTITVDGSLRKEQLLQMIDESYSLVSKRK